MSSSKLIYGWSISVPVGWREEEQEVMAAGLNFSTYREQGVAEVAWVAIVFLSHKQASNTNLLTLASCSFQTR